MCMANTILKQVNDIGAVLGYPFYVYPDGTCGKFIVFGKMNAIGVVKKKFPIKELKSEFLGNIREDDEDVLLHLSKIGEKIGFPFYVYPNGTCGSTPTSKTNKFPFTMVVKQKFEVEQLILDPHVLKLMKQEKLKNVNYGTAPSDDLLTDEISSFGAELEMAVAKAYKGDVSTISYDKSSPFTPSDDDLIWLEKARSNPQMRVWLPQEERAFVLFASVVDGREYFSWHSLSYQGCELLLQRGNKELLKAYVTSQDLYGPALQWMLQKCDEDIIAAYIKKRGFFLQNIEGALWVIAKGSDYLVRMLMQKNNFMSDEETLLVASRSDEIVLAYADISNGFKTIPAQCALVEKHSDDVLKAFIEKYPLCDEAQSVMVEKRNDDVIKAYFKKYPLCEAAETMMVKKCSDDFIKAYFEKYELFQETQSVMVEKRSDDVIKTYFEKYSLCEAAETMMVKKCSDDFIKAYFEKHALWDEVAEKLMIEKCSGDVIKVYVEKYTLCDDAQQLMIEKCSDDIIKVYVEKHKLWSHKAQCLMVKKCSADVIKAYFEKDPLSHDVQCWMLEKCNDEVIISYIQKYSLCDDAQKLMLEKCGDDVVKAYRKKYDIASSLEGLIRKRNGFFWFLRV